MKKYFFLLIIALLATVAMKAQAGDKAPDYNAIQQMMKEDPQLYPSLESRFLRVDEELAVKDLRILYYGKVFRDDYSPYKQFEWTAGINKIMSMEAVKPAVLKKELKNIDQAISDNPVSLECILIKYVICNKLFGIDSKELEYAAMQATMLLDAILSTGDGQSKESAIHVITTSDEHTLMQIAGISWKSQSLLENEGQFYDCFELSDNPTALDVAPIGDFEKLYFNITPCFKKLTEEFSQMTSSETEYSNSIEIPLGTRVTIRLKEMGDGTYQAAVVDRQAFSGEVTDSTFSSENDPDIVELVFANEKSQSGNDKVVLSAKSFNKNPLSFDSFIQYRGQDTFEPTSNVGWYPKALMHEQWYPNIVKIRIANIHIMK